MAKASEIIKEGALMDAHLTHKMGAIEYWEGTVLYLGTEHEAEWAFVVSEEGCMDVKVHSDDMGIYPWKEMDNVMWVES